jgi:competence protein ComEC
MNRWPRHNAYIWETAPFFRLLLPFLAGILAYFYLPWHLSTIYCYAGVALVSVLLLIPLLLQQALHSDGVVMVCMVGFLFGCGGSISAANDVRNDPEWFGYHLSPNAKWLARVAATPAEKDNSWKLTVDIIGCVDGGRVAYTVGKAFVYVAKNDSSTVVHRGDTLLLPGRWEALTDAGNPFEFSYAAYCARNNIRYRQWCPAADILVFGPVNEHAQPLTERAHNWCMLQLARYLGGHKAMGLLQAMIVGDEVNLDEELRHAYSETGIVHIIAISGGNVAIFFMVIAFLLRWLRHRRYLWVKYAIAFPVVWLYVLMAGAQPSATRAAMMFSILAFGIMLQRPSNSINQLLATAFILLFVQPAWLFSVGFQLSCIAVLSILLFYKPIFDLLPATGVSIVGGSKVGWVRRAVYTLTGKLWGVVAMSIAAELLVAPLVIFHFHAFPVMFIVANVAAYVFMGLVLIAGMVLVVVGSLPAVAELIASAIRFGVDVFGGIVDMLQGAGPESFGYLVLSGFETIVVYIIVAGVSFWWLRQYKRALFTALSAACILMFSLCLSEWARLQQQRLVIYNTSDFTHIESITGARFRVIRTDTVHCEDANYASKPAHTFWRAWQQSPSDYHDLFVVGGKTVLILDGDVVPAAPFHADYLVLNQYEYADAEQLLHLCSPGTIVAGGSFSDAQLRRLEAMAQQARVNFHSVARNGAFVLSQ